MSQLLRILALLAFFLAVVLTMTDTPDVFDVLAAGFLGLGLWVGSTLVPGGRVTP